MQSSPPSFYATLHSQAFFSDMPINTAENQLSIKRPVTIKLAVRYWSQVWLRQQTLKILYEKVRFYDFSNYEDIFLEAETNKN